MKNILLGAVCALTIAVPTNAGLWNTFPQETGIVKRLHIIQ